MLVGAFFFLYYWSFTCILWSPVLCFYGACLVCVPSVCFFFLNSGLFGFVAVYLLFSKERENRHGIWGKDMGRTQEELGEEKP